MSNRPAVIENPERIGEVAFDWIKQREKRVFQSNPGADTLEQGRLRLALEQGPFAEPSVALRLRRFTQPPKRGHTESNIARGISSGLIVVGECIRHTRYLQSEDPDDYCARRKNQPNDSPIDIPGLVAKHCENPEALDWTKAILEATILQTADELSDVRNSVKQGLVLGEQDSDQVRRLQELGDAWLGFTVQAIAQASDIGAGQLDDIPLVTPATYGQKEAALYYPFGGPGPLLPKR